MLWVRGQREGGRKGRDGCMGKKGSREGREEGGREGVAIVCSVCLVLGRELSLLPSTSPIA